MTVATIAYSTSTARVRVADRMARVAAAGRVRADRLAREAREAREHARVWDLVESDGQLSTDTEEWCFICGRPTNHLGEHTPDQIDAWRAGRAA